MAMLRVSSYRRLFEEAQWNRVQGRCGLQPRWSPRMVGAADCPWQEPDFEEARALNREGVSRFVRERTLIAELNDRLAFLVETARCLEEENKSLEAQVVELEESRSEQKTVLRSDRVPDLSLEAVMEQLRREKEEILCDVAELKQELQCLRRRHEEVVTHKSLVHQERELVAADVDAVTAECLALRDQVAVYEGRLAALQKAQETRVQSLVAPASPAAVSLVTPEFLSPDVTPVIQEIKEYYCELAESLQFESKAAVATAPEDPRKKEHGPAEVSTAKLMDVAKVTDPDELRKRIAELRRELAELEKCGGELEDQIESRRAAHLEEIAELECCVAELEDAQANLEANMKEHCGDYDELLSEKMALDIEIAAYRGFVEEEEERLCSL
ncbi:glial fibrillary acidic protein [Scleropages formosus]|uniref:glial fibrillary acidic protein n=1 Tax=Scleropages formosus TaxID=113540 RepID=UPI00087856FB|nr:glial fibrillary acidic protein-like [Scleropages formosus]